ncbi:hypothetical protein J9303_14400, partial [Bacillaceae bacterium Marseille-Q3522]|nr:hypothetical protein [Bacillaceae bacterium Marseille-Q3522]
FIQRAVIVLYEVNVYEGKKSMLGYATKYIAIMTSGINYYVQNVINRLPFLLNKLVAILFFICTFIVGFGQIGIFD